MMSIMGVTAQGIYDFKVMDDLGHAVSMADYKGRIVESRLDGTTASRHSMMNCRRSTRNIMPMVLKSSTSPATSLVHRLPAPSRKSTSSARPTSISSSRSSTKST